MDQLVGIDRSRSFRFGKVADLEIPWPKQLWELKGAPTRLCGIKVFYDFDWVAELGSKRCFKNGQELARFIRNHHPEGKIPALLLTTSDEMKVRKHTTDSQYIVIVNIRLIRAAASAHEFLTRHSPLLFADIDAELDLHLFAEFINASETRRREFAQIWSDVNKQVSSQEAIEVLEGREELDEQEVGAITQLLIRCTDNPNALDAVLDACLHASDIERWASRNPSRRKEQFEAMGKLSADEVSAFCRVVGDDSDSQEGLLHLMRRHLPLVQRLAAHECVESDLVATGYRRKQLTVFDQLLNDADFFSHQKEEWGKSRDEDVWQYFFENNKWIFGYGLNYVFMTSLDGRKLEQVTTGFDYQQKGKRADALMKTVGDISNLCFVEIKTHRTELLSTDSYRPECWRASRELAGGIAQSQQTVAKHLMKEQRSQRITDAQDNPTSEEVFFHKPKAFLVIGRLQEFRNEHGVNLPKLSSFEHFRGSITTPEIITFDQLYCRANCILEQGTGREKR